MALSFNLTAIECIAKLGGERVAHALMQFLDNSDEYERAEAARCLARLKCTDALPRMEAAARLPHTYSDSRATMEKALERLRKQMGE